MNDKAFDKKIKSKLNSPGQVPDNINKIFDNFIAENLKQNSARNNIIKVKFSTPKKLITAVASALTTLVAGGAIYAAVTGNSVLELFNINKEKYEQELVSVNEQVTSNDINLILEEYAMDHNAIVVNYTIKTDKTLNFEEGKDNMVIETFANNDIHMKVDKQNYVVDSENNLYKVSTLYSIEQFENTLDQFTLNINVKEIAGIEGEWQFNIDMDKSEKEENRTYGFNEDFHVGSNRIPIKTNYLPIAISVENVSISDFSTMINIIMYSSQYGIPEEQKIEPKKEIGKWYPETQTKEWYEVEPLKFEVTDNFGNILLDQDYDYTRADETHEIKFSQYEKLIFPNIDKDITSLNFNIYLRNDGEKELVGTINLPLDESTNTSNTQYTLDTQKSIADGKITVMVSSDWRFDYDESMPEDFQLLKHDEYGNLIEVSFSNITKYTIEDFSYLDIEDVNNIEELQKAIAEYDIKTTSGGGEIISQGKEQIGIFNGFQSTYLLKYQDHYIKIKHIYAVIDGETYAITYHVIGNEAAYKNNQSFFEDVVKSIKIN